MPEGPPFHALPYDDLLNRLRSLTNYRVMADTATRRVSPDLRALPGLEPNATRLVSRRRTWSGSVTFFAHSVSSWQESVRVRAGSPL